MTLLAFTASGSFAADTNESAAAGTATDAAPVLAAPAPPPSPTNAPAVSIVTNALPAEAFQFPKLSLPPLLDQVVRMNQSGTEEAVLRAYIEKAAPAYQITGNEIIQLQDLGVPRSVILALIEHSRIAAATPALAPEPDVIAPAPATVEAPAAPAGQADDAVPGSAEAAADFRDALAPYGNWLEVPGYGYCWQPTVVVVNPAWRPYCDYGDWRWSNSGWYWNSYYSWGWAPFHYGRWFTHSGRGWLWCPDRVWGPSWVSWRNSSTYCGWAPLPPGACFIAGRGWTFRGASVGVDFSFGLGAAHFTFVSHHRFAERHIGNHAVRGNAALTHYRNTRVVNNYATGPNNRPINHGVGRHQIAAASSTPIREVSAAGPVRVGNRIAAPAAARRSVVRESQASAARPSTALAARPMASGQRIAQRPAPSQPVFQPRSNARAVAAGGPAQQRAIPNYSQNARPRMNAVQPRRTISAAPQRPAMAAPRYQPRTFSHGSVAQRPARSFAPAPRSTGGSVRRATPSGGGGQFRSAPRGGGGSSRSVGVRR